VSADSARADSGLAEYSAEQKSADRFAPAVQLEYLLQGDSAVDDCPADSPQVDLPQVDLPQVDSAAGDCWAEEHCSVAPLPEDSRRGVHLPRVDFRAGSQVDSAGGSPVGSREPALPLQVLPEARLSPLWRSYCSAV
jgi:hypothetical protein